MGTATALAVRRAQLQDRPKLQRIFDFEPFVHRHMDWRMPLDWLGETPYYLAEIGGRIMAALVCPTDPPEIPWIRGFASREFLPPRDAWEMLWPQVQAELKDRGEQLVAAIGMDDWFQGILVSNGFLRDSQVVMLAWRNQASIKIKSHFTGRIRKIQPADIHEILAIDTAAFKPLWRNSFQSIQKSLQQALFATLAEDAAGIQGFQISTQSPLGGHLARLAVKPGSQGKGIASALIEDLLNRFIAIGALQVSVNTQEDNFSSLGLYKKFQFQMTPEKYPIFKFPLS